MSRFTFSAAAVLGAFLLSGSALAQAPAGNGPPGGVVRHFQGGIGFSGPPREQQLAAIKDQLGASDDEWKTLSPKVDKVIQAKQKMSNGAGMSWTSSNNAKPVIKPIDGRTDTAPGKAMQEVRDAVADEGTPPEQLTKKIAAAREAKKKARTEYEAAEKTLEDSITPRQVGILLTLGVVE